MNFIEKIMKKLGFVPISKSMGVRLTEVGDDRKSIITALEKHPLFEELREWSLYRVKVLTIEDDTKRAMAEYYLGVLFGSLREAYINMINNYEKYIDDTVSLNNLIIDTINAVREVALLKGVPVIFLDSFNHYLYNQIRILASTYKDLDNFIFYDTVVERAAFRLDLGLLLVRCITSEVEAVINEMNGELKAALRGSVFDK